MEVVTVQIGHFANHVGAHFWNIQDEVGAREVERAADPQVADVDLNRLYHQVERRGGAVLQPRLLVVDSRGALGAFRPGDSSKAQRQAALEAAQSALLWQGNVESHTSAAVDSHPFQVDLEREEEEQAQYSAQHQQFDESGYYEDDGEEGHGYWDGSGGASAEAASAMRCPAEYDFASSARTWTDFLKVPLPSSSVYELQAFHHNVSEFAFHFDGLQAKGRSDEEELLERIRQQLELCDQPDGVHVLYDAHNGFSGLASFAFDWLAEEMPKSGRLALAVRPEDDEEATSTQEQDALAAAGETTAAPLDTNASSWLSTAFSLAGVLNSGVQTWLPAAVPLWSVGAQSAIAKLDRRNPYESSSLLAAALQSASLPYRLAGGGRASEFLSCLMPSQRPVAGILQAIPLSVAPPAVVAGGAPVERLRGLLPQMVDLSGIGLGQMNPHLSMALSGASPRRLVALTEDLHPLSRRFCFAHALPLPVPLSFPQRFDTAVATNGQWDPYSSSTAREASADVFEFPTLTVVHAAAGGEGRCRPLLEMSQTLKATRRSGWLARVCQRYSVEADDVRDVAEVVEEQLEASGYEASDSDIDS